MKQFNTILPRWFRRTGAVFAALLLLHALAFGDTYQNRQTGVWSNKTTWVNTVNLTGTIAVSTASTAVTGTGTAFLTEYQVGDLVIRASDFLVIGTVSSIGSNTSLTLTANATVTATGIAYRRGRVPGAADDVTITGSSQTVTMDGNFSVASVSVLHAGGNATTTTFEVSSYTLTVSGNVTVTGGSGNRFSRLLVGGGTLTIGGNLNIADLKSTFDLSAGSNSVLNIAGSMTNSGTFTPGASSMVNFNGTSAQSLPLTGFTYANISTNNTAGVTLAAAITATNVTGNLRVLSGPFSNNGNEIAGNAAKTFEVVTGATFIAAGTSAFPTNFTVSLGAGSTVEYSGTTQTVAQQTYGNLTLSGSGTKSTAAAISVLGTLLHSSSGTFSLGAAITQVNKVNIASGTLVDNGNTITVSGTGASTWVRSGAFTATGTTIFTGTAPQIGTSNFSTLQINIGSGNTATATGALSVTNLVLTTGIFNPGAFTHTIVTNFTLASGTKLLVAQTTFAGNYSKNPTTVSNGSTVEYQATGSTVATFTYSNLTISGTITSASAATVDGVFTVTGSFNPGGGTMTFTDGASIVNSGTLIFSGIMIDNSALVSSSSSFTAQGALTVNAGGTFSPTGTVTVSGGSIVNSGGTLVFQNLTLSGTVTANASYSVNSAFVVDGSMNATSGTVTLGNSTLTISSGSISFQNLTISGTVNANVSYEVKGTLSVGGSGNLSPTGGTVTVTGGTITNSGTLSFNNLTTSGTVTMNTSFSVKGTLDNSGTINQASNVLTTQSGATISNSGSLTLNGLTVAGSTTGSGNFTVNGTLALNANLAMGANVLTMGGSATTTGSADVTGTVRRTSFSLATAYTFGNPFTTVTFNTADALPTSIDVTIAIGSAPSAKSNAITRYFGITEAGGTGYNAKLQLHYLTGELNGNTASALNMWRKPAGTYVNDGRSDFNTSDKWVARGNVSVLSAEWTLADKPSETFTAGNSGNWNDPATWGESGSPVEGINYPGPVDSVHIGSNFAVTLTASHSAMFIDIQGDNGINGTTLLDVDSYTLNVGSSGVRITGGNTDSRIARLRVAGGTLTVTGPVALDASSAPRAVLDIGSGTSTLNVGGALTMTGTATFTAGTSSIVNFNGASAQTVDVANFIFANVRTNNTSGSGATLNANVTTSNISGNLRVLSGTLSNGGFSIAGGALKTFEVANGATFKLGGTSSFPTGFGTVTIGGTSTIRYEGSNQSIAQQPYGHLTIDGSGPKTVSTALTVSGTLTHLASTTTLSATGGDDLVVEKMVLTGGTLNDNGRIIMVTGTGSGVWDKNPAATFTTSGVTVFTGFAPQIGASNFSTLQVNVGGGNTATALGALTTANFTVTSGIFDPGLFTHTISTDLTLNAGSKLLVTTTTYGGNYTRTPDLLTGSTIEYIATGSTLETIAYANLTVSGTVTGSSTASVDGVFTVSNSFTPSGGTLTFNNGASIVNSGTMTFANLSIDAGASVSSSTNYSVTGTMTVGSGATYAPTGTITLSGATLANSGSLTFQHLTLSGTVTANSSYTVNGTFAGGGTLDASSGTVTLGSGATLATSGTISFSNLTVGGSATANVSYTIKGALSIGASGNLSPTSGTVTVTNGASISNSGTLSFQNLTTSGTVTMNTSFTVKGTFSNSGTVNQSSGTLTTSSGASIANSSSLSLNNLTVSGATTGSNDFVVNGTLTLNANLAMGANTLTMGSSSTTAGMADVSGTVRRTSFTTGTAYSFGNAFTSINFVSASVLPTSVDVTVSFGSAPPEKSDAILRTYAVTETGGSGYAATLRLHYLDGELNGNDESSLNLWFKSGGSYVDSGSTASNNSDNWVEKSGLTSLGTTWTMANFAPTGFIAAATGNWNVGATWGNPGDNIEGSGYPGSNDIANINGNFTVTVTSNQSIRKIVMQPTSGGPPVTSTLNINEGLTMSVGTGGIVLNSSSGNRDALINGPSVTLTVDGSISISAGALTDAVIDLRGGTGVSTLNLKGSIARPAATAGQLLFDSDGVLNLNGSGSQTLDVQNSTFGSIYVNNTSIGGVELIGAITTTNVAGDLLVESGTFNNGGNTIAGNTGKMFGLAAGTTFILSGTSVFPTGFTTDISPTSTVNYSGGAQTISDQAYGNLTLSGSGSKTIASSISVANNFTYSGSASTSLSGTAGHNLTVKTFTLTAGTFNDNGRTITVNGTSGQVWTKSGGTFTASGTVSVTGSGAQIGASNFATLNLNVGVGNAATATGALSITNLTLTTGTFDPGTHLHSISSAFTVGTGTTLLVRTTTFGANYSSNPTAQAGSTIEYTSTGATVSGAFVYRNLRISGTVTGASSATVNEKLTVTGTFTPSTGKMVFNDGAEIINNGTLTFRRLQISVGATVTSSTSFSINDSLIIGQNAVFQPTGTVSFVSGGAIDVSPVVMNEGTLSLNNLSVSAAVGTASSFSISGTLNVQVNGEISPTGGKITMTAGSTIINSWILSFHKVEFTGTVTANTDFAVKDSLIVGPSGTLSPTSGTITLEDGTKVLNNGNLSFGGLEVNGTVTANTNFTVKSSISVSSGANLTATAGTVTMNTGATFANEGTLSFNNLTVAGGVVSASNGFAVSGALTLNGDLALGSNILDLGTTATIGGTSDVTGNVRRSGTFSLSTAYAFGSQYTSVTFASGTPPTSLTMNVTKGTAPIEKPEAILRYNEITTSGGGAYSATLRLRFLTGELNGNDASTLTLWRRVGVSPYADSGRTANNLVNNWVEKSGLTAINGTWTMSRQNPIGFIAVVTGDWNDPATWGYVGAPAEGVNYPGPTDIANIINNLTVTLTANHSVARVNVEGPTTSSTALLEVGAYTLTIGTGGLRLTGGTNDAQIAKVTVAGGTLSVAGDLIFTTGSAVRAQLDMSLGSNSTLAIGGAMTKNTAGTFTPGSTGVVNFNSATGGQTLNMASFTFSNVRINNTSGSGVTLGANLTTSNVTGDVRVQSGDLNNGGFSMEGNGGKTFEVANGATLNLTGTSAFPTGFTMSLGTSSTVNYAGSAHTISNQNYGNLILSGSGGHTVNSSLSVAGAFTYSSSGSTSLSSTGGQNLTTSKFSQTSGTFSDNGRTIIVTGTGAGTWSKSGGTFTATGTARFSGSAPQIGSSNFGTLEIDVNGGNTATATGSLTPTHLVITSGTFDPGSFLHTITTNFTLANATTLKVATSTFSGNYSKSPTTVNSGSTVEYTNASTTISNAFTYSGLKVSGTVTGSSSPSIGGVFTVSGTFNNPGGTVTFNDGASIAVSGGTLNFTNLTVAASSTVTSSSDFGVNGTLSVGGSTTFAPANTITMLGGSTITNAGSLTFGTLFVAGTVTANSSYSVGTSLSIGFSGNLSPTSGTVTMTGTSNISNLGTLELYGLAVNGTITTSSTFSVSNFLSVGGSGSLTASAGTITMNGGSSFTNSNVLTFFNLTTGSGTITSSSNFSVAGTLDIATGSTFNPSGTVTMNAGSAITQTGSGSFSNLTVGGGTVTGNSSFTVTGTLTLNGTLAMGSNTLDLGVGVPLISGTGDVTGSVRRQGTFSTSTEYSFGNRFTSLNFASGTLTGSVTVNSSIGSAPAEKLDAILRKYTITESGISGYSVKVRLHYLDGELNANTASSMTLWYKSGGSYINQNRTGSTDETDKWVEKNALTALAGDWTLANQPAVGFTTVATGNWNVGATWGNVGDDVEGSGYPGATDIANVTGGFTITVTQTHTVQTLNITGNTNGAALVEVGANSLTVNGSLLLTGGNTDARVARTNVAGGTLTVKGNITYSTATAVRAVIDLSGAANSVLNLGGSMTKSTAGTFTPGTTSTVNFNGTAAQTIDVTNFTYANVHVNNAHASGATIGAAVSATNITANLRIPSGIFSNGGFAIVGGTGDTFEVGVGATFKLLGTTGFPTGFTTNTVDATSSVEYIGGAQTIAILSYGNLVLGGTGSKTISGVLDVGGTLTYSSIGTTTLSSAVNTSKFVLSNGTLNDGGVTITVSGTGSGVWSKTGGTFTATGTARFTGAAPEINASNFGTLELQVGVSGTALATGILSTTNLVLTSGTFDPGVYGHTVVTNFTLANDTRILVRGGEFVTNYSKTPTSIGTSGTVEYTSGSAQTINQTISYSNLKLTGSGAKSAGGALTVNDSLVINTGATFSGMSYNHQIKGAWVNNGGYTAGTGTITLSGASAQTIGGTSATTFNNLTINNAAGITINASPTVNGVMTFTSGNVTTGANKVTVSSTGTVSRTSGHLVGNFEKHVAAGPTSKTFEIGDASNYTPVSLAFDNVSSGGFLTAKVAQGDHPNIATSSIEPDTSANRYWTLTTGGLSFTTYSATFNFVSGDLDLNADPLTFVVSRYDGGNWSDPTVGTITSTSTQATGVSAFGDFIVGAPASADFLSIATGNWTTGSTWDKGRTPKRRDRVTIDVSHTVTLTDAREVTNLTINNSGVFNSNGNTLTVYGDITINGTWSGSGTIDWVDDAKTLTGSGSASGTSILQITGTNHTVDATANLMLFQVNIPAGKSITNNGAMSLTRLTGGSGASTWTQGTNANLTVLQDLLTTGTLTATASGNTVTYAGNSAQSVKTSTYHHLSLAGSGTKTLSAALSIDGDLSVNAGVLDLGSFTADRASAGGTLNVANGATLKIGGTGTIPGNYSTHSIGTTSTIEYSGTTPTIATLNSGQAYGSLVISGSGTKTLAGSVAVAFDLTVQSGTLDLDTFTADRVTGGGTLTVSNGAVLQIGGTGTIPANYSTHVVGSTSTVEYNGSNQSITILNSSQSYGHLTLSGTGTKVFSSGATGIQGNFVLNAGPTVDATTNSSTILLNGMSGSQALAVIDYYHLSFNNASSKILGTGTTRIAGDFTVSGGSVDATTNSTTIEYNGTGAQSVGGITYHFLHFSNGGLKTIAVATTVNAGMLVNTSASVLVSNSGSLTLGGDLENDGILTNEGTIEVSP